ncbi:MAG: hypothetical protein WDN31_05365 [Hyphomicrobium sp.]
MRLTAEDDGIGFDPEAVSSGMGMRLIQGITAQLQGTSHYEHGGEWHALRARVSARAPAGPGFGARRERLTTTWRALAQFMSGCTAKTIATISATPISTAAR